VKTPSPVSTSERDFEALSHIHNIKTLICGLYQTDADMADALWREIDAVALLIEPPKHPATGTLRAVA